MLLAAGCATRSPGNAPVEDRGTGMSRQQSTVTEAVKQLPGFENAGKPGYYTVRPGDTMIRIGLESGQNWRDIVRWNALENPNLIEVGQVLRVAPPVSEASQVVTRPVSSGSVAAAPVPAASASATAKPASAPASAAAPVVAAAPTPAPTPAAINGDEDVGWIWPAQGQLIAGFDDAKNKGLDIAGKAGDAVLASADGRVVYSGAGLRGYGNLIILKHNNTFLTAYAHNQTLLVKEDQAVKKGQKIAEMGNSDADRVKLHFEIRRQGKPVDPAKYLPAK
ncbi:lipoprotein NlpD [Polaromonas sp. OV174]|uniref:peptidoglycan DD-metalloendopeptidase family protein n=1 Tax=Polaromonas sp. OV174 TaxID=1855300 RepID=UPI0008E04B87|nr:peptidoglycan DD-metalloendopeptidase family protein [Polaromonas sp. OV174]SFC54845.1 lipoprotein NlpD [Polaromonas sp. OV174]